MGSLFVLRFTGFVFQRTTRFASALLTYNLSSPLRVTRFAIIDVRCDLHLEFNATP